jgi:hypothetical protein
MSSIQDTQDTQSSQEVDWEAIHQRLLGPTSSEWLYSTEQETADWLAGEYMTPELTWAQAAREIEADAGISVAEFMTQQGDADAAV